MRATERWLDQALKVLAKAAPPLRGQPRVAPGTPIPAPAPLWAELDDRGVVQSLGWDGRDDQPWVLRVAAR